MKRRLIWLGLAAVFFIAGLLVFVGWPGLALLLWLVAALLIVIGALV